MVAEKYNLKINYINITESFDLDLDHFESLLNSKTKVVSIVGESNMSGMLPDIQKMNSLVKEKTDAIYIVDGAQLVPHRKIDVQELGIDFYLCFWS